MKVGISIIFVLFFFFLNAISESDRSPNLLEMVLPRQNSVYFASSAVSLKGDISQASK